jgi:outer membrane protein OmpU
MPSRAAALAALLVLIAPPAAAELRLSGDARMGVVYDSAGDDDARSALRLDSRARLRVALRRETDIGLTFGIAVDLDAQRPPPGRRRD